MTPKAPPRGEGGGGSPLDHATRSSSGRPSNRSRLTFPEVFDRGKAFFRGRETLEGVLARRILNATDPADPDTADHLIRLRRRRSRMDGSLAGSLILTARAVWELMELGAPPDHAAVVRMSGYLLTRQNKDGRWSEDGEAGDGFFSPGPRADAIAPLELPSRTVFSQEDDARFVASCLALRAVLRAGHDQRGPVRTHLDGLLSIRAIDPHLAFVAVGAFGAAPPEYLDRIGSLVASILERQQADGSWDGVTIFHAVDMLLGVPTADARAAVRGAAPLLAALQREDGAFDETGSEAIALIALRAIDASRTAA